MITRSNSHFIILGIVLAICTLQSNARVLVHTKNDTKYELNAIEIIYLGNDRPKITEELSSSITMDINDVSEKFYLLQTSRSADEHIIEAQNNGALAVLCATIQYVPGSLRYAFTDQSYVRQISIPVYEIAVFDGNDLISLYNNNEVVEVTLVPSDEVNQWDLIFLNYGYMAWMIFNAAFFITNIALCIWKLHVFVDFYGGFRTSIAFFVLLIELISNAIRVVWLANMLCFQAFPWRLSGIFLVLSYPFAIASYLLFTLYWHEIMTTSSVIVHPFIVKMRIPFYVICAVMAAQYIISIILLYTTDWNGMATLTAFFLLVLIAALVTFYIITSVKILMRLRQSQKIGRAVQLRKTTIKMVIGAGFLFVFLLITVLFVCGLMNWPDNYTISNNTTYTLLGAASMVNILAFDVIPLRSTKTGSKKTSSDASARVTDPKETSS